MATWIIAGDLAYPLWASKNYINQDGYDSGGVTASEMQALVDRIIDGDPLSQWVGSVAADGTEVILTLSFYEGAARIARSPDLLIFQNINWKNFVGEWSVDGVYWTTIASLDYAVTNNEATDIIVNPSDILLAKHIRVRITNTITANAKKRCGGVIACNGVVQCAGGYTDDKVKYREQVREVVLADGTISREYILRSAVSYDFWGMSFSLLNATAAEKTLLRGIKVGGDPFILVPEPANQPREAYLCHFDGPWGHEYESPVRPLGFRLPIKVKEVGSH